MSNAPFTHSISFEIKIACHHYFHLGRVISYCKETNCYKKEAWFFSALRMISWGTVVLPIAIKIVLMIADHFARDAIQERVMYWSGKNSHGEKLILQPPTPAKLSILSNDNITIWDFHARRAEGKYPKIPKDEDAKKQLKKFEDPNGLNYIWIKKRVIQVLSHSDVPKTPFDHVYLQNRPCGRSYVGFSTDTEFPEGFKPLPERKILHVFWEQDPIGDKESGLHNKSFWYKMKQNWAKNLELPNAEIYGLLWSQVHQMVNGGHIPDGFKMALATGVVDYGKIEN